MDLAGNETNSIGFLLRVWRLAALFPFDWSIKSALPLLKPGPITESNFKSQAVCPALPATRNSLSTLPKSGSERELVILAPILLRDPLIVAFCRWPFDPCWPQDIMLPAGQTRVKGDRADHDILKTHFQQLTVFSLLLYICPPSHSSTVFVILRHGCCSSKTCIWHETFFPLMLHCIVDSVF